MTTWLRNPEETIDWFLDPKNYPSQSGMCAQPEWHNGAMITLDGKYTPNPETGCWEWNKPSSIGYGAIDVRSRGVRRVLMAHRVMWEMRHGLTAAEHVHHKCENRRCVNPDHLQPMTHKENNRLAYSTWTKGECERGHTNLGTKPSGGHYCRTCNTDRMRRVRHDALVT